MIEMLAVLAVMGVLTIGGIAGYTFAISKHRANQIYEQVDLRAIASFGNPFVRQTQVGQTYPLTGFDEVVEDITYQHKKTAGNGYDIIAAHVPERVCKRLQDMAFPIPHSVTLNGSLISSTCGNDNTFVFSYDGLAIGKPSSGITPIDCNCSGCQSCESGTCQDNDNLCGPKEVCVTGSCQCAPGYEECGGSCYTTCGEGFMRDPVSCDCVCDPQECPKNATWNSLTCACECDEGYDMCGGACHPACTGSGMTGERDPDSCACICLEGTNADTCACPEGYIYVDGMCQRLECKGLSEGNYICYINDKVCGKLCDSKGKTCNQGYCYPTDCSEGWDFTPGPEAYGCKNNNGRQCYLQNRNSSHFVCINPNLSSTWYCCWAHNQSHLPAYCTEGSCYEGNICSQYGGQFKAIYNATWGCDFGDGLTCTKYGAANSEIEEINRRWKCLKYGAECGRNCTDPLNCGTCNETKCFDGGSYNTELKMCCQTTVDGKEVCCNELQDCFIYENNTLYQCGDNCNPQTLECSGSCSTSTCSPNSELVYKEIQNTFGVGACYLKDKNLYAIARASSTTFGCYFTDTMCGNYCDENCQNCLNTFHQACTSSKECVYGVKEEETIYGEPCICASGIEGIDSNGNRWCCAPGHTFINGGCTLINCPDGQVADENGICKTACENNAEVLNCVCDGTIYTNVFNAKICCESGYSWNENTQTCQ